MQPHAERSKPTGVTVLSRALEAKGRQIIHLQIGEPDFSTPAPITEAAIAALRAGSTHYTPSPGTMALRTAIAEFVGQDRGVKATPAGAREKKRAFSSRSAVESPSVPSDAVCAARR